MEPSLMIDVPQVDHAAIIIIIIIIKLSSQRNKKRQPIPLKPKEKQRVPRASIYTKILEK
eukprot:556669-Amphidinium_carterae.1